MTVLKKELKTAKKAEKEAKVAEAVAEAAVESGARGVAKRHRVGQVAPGSYSKMARMHKHVATAQFLAGLFHPFDSPSRFPDKMNLMKTIVLPFRETATVVASGGQLNIQITPSLQRVLHMVTGTTTWGTTSICTAFPSDKMFTAAKKLAGTGASDGFVLASRCTGMRVSLQWAAAFTSAQGQIVGAVVPPGTQGTLSTSFLSQLPHSAVSSIPEMLATGAFSICWLPQRAAGNYSSAYSVASNNQPYDPLEFIPFNDETNADSGSMPFIQINVDSTTASGSLIISIEGTFECDAICGDVLGDDVRPDEGAWEVLDDTVDQLFEQNSGVQPNLTVSEVASMPPQQRTVRAVMASPPPQMSESTASFLDEAAPILSKVGSGAWDLVKEYGPDVLSSVVGLLPGGSLATTAAKIGGALGRALL